MSSKSVKDNFMQRTNADLLRVLTVALRQRVNDDSLVNVSILRVECGADLSTARVFVTGGEKALNASIGFFRNEIAQNLKIRRVPNLRFIVDTGGDNAARVEELLKIAKGEV